MPTSSDAKWYALVLAIIVAGSLVCFNSRSSGAPQVQDNSSWHSMRLMMPGQPTDLQDSMSYKHYYIGKSNIPGAGMGAFAKHDMPAGERL